MTKNTKICSKIGLKSYFVSVGLLAIMMIVAIGFVGCAGAETTSCQDFSCVVVNNDSQNFTTCLGCNLEEYDQKDEFDVGLLGGFPIKQSSGGKEVLLGGFPIGINVKVDGLVITNKCSVVTNAGVVEPLGGCDIASGDILVAIDGKKVKCQNDIVGILLQSGDKVELTICRGGVTRKFAVVPVIDALNGSKRLGLVLQDGVLGIGTMTFVEPNSNTFACLGHPIKDRQGGNVVANGGEIFDAQILSVKKGQRGSAGELNGNFANLSKNLGTVSKNNDYGLYGKVAKNMNLPKIAVAPHDEVRAGKAKIYTTIAGAKPKLYDIEIIKACHQSSKDDKSMVIRVVDKELLDISGGIVQGMSGSPILQNGRLVGAVTHVFVNDPTKGYGLYADWMLSECA